MQRNNNSTPYKATNNNDSKPVIIAIGASAGGLEAIQDFFKDMPLDSGLSFVVIQHLSPDYKSLMDELLARHTKIPIHKVEDGMTIEPDSIYLIPPRMNMSIYHGQLFLKEQQQGKGVNLPIDIFFRSLAAEMGKKSIGVILSGTGSDGTLGTRAIKEAGGMIMVQDDQTAKFDGMPRSSISTGLVDYILPAKEMAEAIMKYSKHPFVEKKKSLKKEISEQVNGLAKILHTLREFSGIDFSFYKENTILRRLERRLSINHLSTFEDYLELLNDSDKEKSILYRELFIGVTSFFRDDEAFMHIEQSIIPSIFGQGKDTIRIWVAGCSTGEEAYSLGILLLEYADKMEVMKEIKIFATDIDKDSIEFASNGFYPDSIVSDIDPELLTKYFTRKENGYHVGETLRKAVIFATHNVLKDPPFSKIDLISCRNLFIYLKPEIQTNILSMFYFALAQGGYLFLGHSETVGDMSEGFNTVNSKWKIYQYKQGYKAPIGREIPLPKVTNLEMERSQRNHFMDTLKSDFIAEKVFSFFVPPSIIIDSNGRIIQMINDTNSFLRFPKGKFTNDLFKLLPTKLKVIISSLLRRIRGTDQVVVFENVEMHDNGEGINLKLEGRKVHDKTSEHEYYVISFVASEKAEKDEPKEVVKLDEQYHEKMGELEKELQFTKENLQATVEELETSNEELQSSNEELIASNEELQSTNEELQSVNEELYTVNSEYQNKIEELTRLNNDVTNLLRNTNIGTLYLDRKLCIRKFTPSISSITNIRDMDIGRPIFHITVTDYYPELIDDIKQVLDNLQPIEKEVKDKNGKWQYIKIMPYRTQDNAIDGIIITFVNITTLKETEEKSRMALTHLSLALEMGRMAWWEYNIKTGKVIYDDRKATMIGYTPEEFPDDVYEIMKLVHPDDYEKAMQAMRDHFSGEKDQYQVVYRIKKKQGGYSWFYDKGGIVERAADGSPSKITGIVIDITAQQIIDQQKNKSERIIERILENNPMASTFVDKEGRITYANKKAGLLFGISQEEMENRTYSDPQWIISDLKGKEIPAEKLPFSLIKETGEEIRNFQHYITQTSGERLLLTITGCPVLDEKEKFEGAIFNISAIKA